MLAFAGITFLHIVFGELAPKSIALQRLESTALFVSRPTTWFLNLFRPVIWLMNTLGNSIVRLIGIELQMVSTHAAVHIGGSDFMAIHPMFGKKNIADIEANLLPSAKVALDELHWWAKATMAAKAAA